MGIYAMKNQHKKQKSPSRWVVTIGSLRFETRGVQYGAKRRAEIKAENLFYLAYWDEEHRSGRWSFSASRWR